MKLSDEFYKANRSRWPIWQYRLKHPFKAILEFTDFDRVGLSLWQSIPRFLLAYSIYFLVIAFIAVILIVASFFTGLSDGCVLLIALACFFYLIWRSEKKR